MSKEKRLTSEELERVVGGTGYGLPEEEGPPEVAPGLPGPGSRAGLSTGVSRFCDRLHMAGDLETLRSYCDARTEALSNPPPGVRNFADNQ